MPYYQRERSITVACPRTPYHSLTFQLDVRENPLEPHPNVTFPDSTSIPQVGVFTVSPVHRVHRRHTVQPRTCKHNHKHTLIFQRIAWKAWFIKTTVHVYVIQSKLIWTSISSVALLTTTASLKVIVSVFLWSSYFSLLNDIIYNLR